MNHVLAAGRVLTTGQAGASRGGRGRHGELGATRHMEAAESDRLNKTNWVGAGDVCINSWLDGELPRLRMRCQYEGRNNEHARGIIETYKTHVVGPEGPKLQVICGDKKWAGLLEKRWREFSESADLGGVLSLADMAQLWAGNCWDSGEYVAQIVWTRDGVRVNNIEPRRLGGGWQGRFDVQDGRHQVMGIERDRFGRPLRYWIQEQRSSFSGQIDAGRSSAHDARDIIHGFDPWYPNQARGVPWLAPALQTCASLRQYEKAVLEAAKLAARLTALLTQSAAAGADIDSDFEAPELYDIEPGTIATMPPGFEMSQLKAEQPTTTYKEFTNELMRRIGRVKGMPLMVVRLDAGDHTFSSAHFDKSIYQTHVQVDQQRMKRRAFVPLLRNVARWTALNDNAGREPEWSARWIFPNLPDVDPIKVANAEMQAMENGTLNLTDALAARGKDVDEFIESKRQDIQKLNAAGLPLGPLAGPKQPGAAQPEPKHAETDDDETNSKAA